MSAVMIESLQAAFRSTMASVCTPVSVATTMAGDRPHGTTVSAFASLSMAPPMVLVSLDRGSALLSHVQASRRFGLNILSADQADAALSFALKGDAKFDGVDWIEDRGLPRLAGVVGWLACDVAQLVGGGDHVIVLGNVVNAEHTSGAPLTYYAREFGTHHRYLGGF